MRIDRGYMSSSYKAQEGQDGAPQTSDATGASQPADTFETTSTSPRSKPLVALTATNRVPEQDSSQMSPAVREALDELKAAEQQRKQANGSNDTILTHADDAVAEAEKKLEQAIKSSGIPLDKFNAEFSKQSTDPNERLMVAEAGANLARDNADAVAKSYGLENLPNAEGRDPNDHHLSQTEKEWFSKLTDAQRKSVKDDTRNARMLEGQMQDQLIECASQAASDLRDQGKSREDALKQLKETAAGDTAFDVLGEKSGVPNTIGMTQKEKYDLYQKRFLATASKEAIDAYNSGQRVVLGLRHDTPLYENGGKGVFDDRFVVLQKPSVGAPSDTVGFVKEYRACLDPNTMYGNGMREKFQTCNSTGNTGPYATRNNDGTIDAYGRVASGQTIRFQTGPDDKLDPPPDGGYKVQADLDGDGNWDYSDGTGTEMGNGYELHGSAVGHTGSGGCLTVPFYLWDDFKKDMDLENQPTVDSGHWYNPLDWGKKEHAVYVTIAPDDHFGQCPADDNH